MWISPTKELNGVWIWRTNYKPVTYTNFETNPASHQEQCNLYRVANNTWLNTTCTEYINIDGNFIPNMHNVICEPISEKVAYANLKIIGAPIKDSLLLRGEPLKGYHHRIPHGHHHKKHRYNQHHHRHHPVQKKFHHNHHPLRHGNHHPLGHGNHHSLGHGNHHPLRHGNHHPLGHGNHHPLRHGNHHPLGHGNHHKHPPQKYHNFNPHNRQPASPGSDQTQQYTSHNHLLAPQNNKPQVQSTKHTPIKTGMITNRYHYPQDSLNRNANVFNTNDKEPRRV